MDRPSTRIDNFKIRKRVRNLENNDSAQKAYITHTIVETTGAEIQKEELKHSAIAF
jgi:hypothetical protein